MQKYGAISADELTLTRVERVLYIQKTWRITAVEVGQKLLLNVATTIFYPDANLVVIKIAPIKLEELYQQDG